MEQSAHSDRGVVVQNTLITLPIEVLVYICSFLSVRDGVKIRCVSKILRRVGETPSLWKTFIWSLYPPRDSKLLERVLKMFGEHIKQFHFADVPPSKLEVMLKFCKNVTHLSLPRFTYCSDILKLEKIVCSMGSLQILDIQGCTGINIQQVFVLASNLKELSIYHRSSCHNSCYHMPVSHRLSRRTAGYRRSFLSSNDDDKIPQWIEQWANSNYVPRKLNVVVTDYEWNHEVSYNYTHPFCQRHFDPTYCLKYCLLMFKNKKLSNVLHLSNIAWLNFCFKTSVDFESVVPHMQVRITDSSVTFPAIRGSLVGLDLPLLNMGHGLPELENILQITQGSCRGKKTHKALLIGNDGIDEYIGNSVTNLTSVTDFDVSYIRGLLPEHLEWLSIACPNLQRLNLSNNARCLVDLEGLRSLAKNCKHLRCLNLIKIDKTYIAPPHIKFHGIEQYEYTYNYDHRTLWEILLTMQLIELYLEEWMFIVGARHTNVFQEYPSLQTLEVTHETSLTSISRVRPDDVSLLLLSYFPSLTYFKLNGILPSESAPRALKQIFSCRNLRCLLLLVYSHISVDTPITALEGHCLCLQELYIDSRVVLAETFISALCAHGGLKHVKFRVHSLTVRSIISLIKHSPNLMTFEIDLVESRIVAQLKHLIALVTTKFFETKLINEGSFSIIET